MIKFKVTVFLIFMLAWPSVQGSTFVGNGGNSKDVELQVTLLQVQKALKQVQLDGAKDTALCECDSNLEGHKLCEVLKALNADQKKQCKEDLVQASHQILNLLQDPKGVQIIWTLEAMQVSEKAGLRQAEGVAVLKDKKIFLNREEFLNLKDYERIFLVTHELAHLVSFNQKYIQDDEKYKSFQQDDGGRQFLNSLGASVAMKSFATGAISDYVTSLSRSKNSRSHWFSFLFTSESSQKDQAAFSIESYKGFHARYRFQINETLGIGLGLKRLSGEQTFFDTAHTKGDLKMMDAFVAYRWLPFSDPFSIWGPSHFVFTLGVQSGEASIAIDDGIVTANDRAKFMAPQLTAEYDLPLIHGVWVQFAVNYSNYSYELKDIGYQSEKDHTNYGIGVAYAF